MLVPGSRTMWLNHWLESASALNHWPADCGAPVFQRVPVFQSSAFAGELPDSVAVAVAVQRVRSKGTVAIPLHRRRVDRFTVGGF